MVFGHINTDDCPYPTAFSVNAYFFVVVVVVVVVIIVVIVVIVVIIVYKSKSSSFYLHLYTDKLTFLHPESVELEGTASKVE